MPPTAAIAHGSLSGGPVWLFGSDLSPEDPPVRIEGAMLSLLGTAEPRTSRYRDGTRLVDDWVSGMVL